MQPYNHPVLETEKKSYKKGLWVHITAILLVMGLPFFIINLDFVSLSMMGYVVLPSALILLLFYANYNLLIDKFLFPKRYWPFVLSNIGLIVICFQMLNSRGYSQFKREYRHQERMHFIQLFEEQNNAEERRRFRRFYNEIKDYHSELDGKKRIKGPYGHNDRRHISGVILLCFISALTSIGIKSNQQVVNESTKRKFIENEYLKSQNAFLSYQIQPHFFFNTLNSIHALIDISKEDAKNTVIDLSKLMRYVLNVSEQNEVPIKKEIDFLTNYCDLMKLRISDDFKFTFETILSSEDKLIAPLLFIVLVENAFKHGVSGQESDFIHISCIQNESTLIFSVHNSRYEHTVQTSQDSSIGIENLKTRLQLMYPNKHQLQIVEGDNDYKSILTITS